MEHFRSLGLGYGLGSQHTLYSISNNVGKLPLRPVSGTCSGLLLAAAGTGPNTTLNLTMKIKLVVLTEARSWLRSSFMFGEFDRTMLNQLVFLMNIFNNHQHIF